METKSKNARKKQVRKKKEGTILVSLLAEMCGRVCFLPHSPLSEEEESDTIEETYYFDPEERIEKFTRHQIVVKLAAASANQALLMNLLLKFSTTTDPITLLKCAKEALGGFHPFLAELPANEAKLWVHLGLGQLIDRKPEESLASFLRAAKLGDADAHNALVIIYRTGIGEAVAANTKEYEKWKEKTAKLNKPSTAYTHHIENWVRRISTEFFRPRHSVHSSMTEIEIHLRELVDRANNAKPPDPQLTIPVIAFAMHYSLLHTFADIYQCYLLVLGAQHPVTKHIWDARGQIILSNSSMYLAKKPLDLKNAVACIVESAQLGK